VSSLEGKVALITGGASGLGLEVARQMAASGARLVLVDWDQESLQGATAQIADAGGVVKSLRGDVSDPATATAAIETVRAAFGRLDILFNNAGIDPLRARSVVETEVSEWGRILDVNVGSAYLMSRAAVPFMREGGGGSIVNTASVAGIKPGADEAAYSVSKAAMISLTASLALDFAADGIRANCVCPGFMEMVMTDRRRDLTEEQQTARAEGAAARVPLGRQGTYEEVAKAVLFLAGPEASYVTGAALVVDGGLLLK
jgi:NAD(P)-dependent dehydrogenase (short-subunit alcohol dehydrogenase family)